LSSTGGAHQSKQPAEVRGAACSSVSSYRPPVASEQREGVLPAHQPVLTDHRWQVSPTVAAKVSPHFPWHFDVWSD